MGPQEAVKRPRQDERRRKAREDHSLGRECRVRSVSGWEETQGLLNWDWLENALADDQSLLCLAQAARYEVVRSTSIDASAINEAAFETKHTCNLTSLH